VVTNRSQEASEVWPSSARLTPCTSRGAEKTRGDSRDASHAFMNRRRRVPACLTAKAKAMTTRWLGLESFTESSYEQFPRNAR
jgi:hypothetical protein